MNKDNDRQADWATWLNKLTFCYGCGRFGMPSKGKLPRGWKTLYQPHPDGCPGLHVCCPSCESKIRDAMTKGAVTEPLEMRPPPMPHELHEQVCEIVKVVADEERVRYQKEILARIQARVDAALLAAVDTKGSTLTKREAIDVVSDIVVNLHFNIGMVVTAKIEVDDSGVATAEVIVVEKNGFQHGDTRDSLREQGIVYGLRQPSLLEDIPIPYSVLDAGENSEIADDDEEVEHVKQIEFTTLKQRDRTGKKVHFLFQPSEWVEKAEEKQNDGEVEE